MIHSPVPAEELEKTLKEKYPKWTQENYDFVTSGKDLWEQVRRETLCEIPCVDCNVPMGQHSLDSNLKLIHPKE